MRKSSDGVAIAKGGGGELLHGNILLDIGWFEF